MGHHRPVICSRRLQLMGVTGNVPCKQGEPEGTPNCVRLTEESRQSHGSDSLKLVVSGQSRDFSILFVHDDEAVMKP